MDTRALYENIYDKLVKTLLHEGFINSFSLNKKKISEYISDESFKSKVYSLAQKRILAVLQYLTFVKAYLN